MDRVYKKPFRAVSGLVVLILVFVSTFPTSIHAEQRTLEELLNVGIYYFDPEGSDDKCNTNPRDYGGNSNREIVFNYFVNKGLSKDIAAAFVGNFMTETKGTMDPRITQGGGIILDQPFDINDGKGFGIAQWTYHTRKENFEKFADATGRSQYLDVIFVGQDELQRIRPALGLQLDFVWFELTGQPPTSGLAGGGWSSTFEQIKENSQTIGPIIEATVEINAHYEMSALGLEWKALDEDVRWSEENIRKYHGSRIDYANKALEEFSGTGTYCPPDGGYITPDGYAYPLVGTKSELVEIGGAARCSNAHPPPIPYHYQGCHHHYFAADLFGKPNETVVVAATSGVVTNFGKGSDNDVDQCFVTPTLQFKVPKVRILGDDGYGYYYTHLAPGTLTKAVGERVEAGEVLGRIGPKECAQNTPPHLHFDIRLIDRHNPNNWYSYYFDPDTTSRSGNRSFGAGDYVDPYPLLKVWFNVLPE